MFKILNFLKPKQQALSSRDCKSVSKLIRINYLANLIDEIMQKSKLNGINYGAILSMSLVLGQQDLSCIWVGIGDLCTAAL